MTIPLIADLATARQVLAAIGERLQAAHITTFREPPPEPDTCCGRGCNGCVWEGYYAAVGWWCEDAEAAIDARLQGRPGP